MESLLQFIQDKIPWLIEYKYLFLFLGSLIEGLNTMVFGGFLASIKAVNLLAVFVVMTIGHTLNGYIWYSVGYLGGAKTLDKWGHREKLSHDIIEKITNYFNRYSGRTILVTKFTFSLQIVALIMAGSLKHNMKEFSKYNFLGSLGWAFITIFIGYIFGQSFQLFVNFLKSFTYFIIAIAGAIALVIIIKLLMKSVFIKTLRIDAKIREWNKRIKNNIDFYLSNDKEEE